MDARAVAPVAECLARAGLAGFATLSGDGTVLSREGPLSAWLPEAGLSCFESPILSALEDELAGLDPAGDPLVLPGLRLAVDAGSAASALRCDILIARSDAGTYVVLTTVDHADRPIDHWVLQQKREQRLLEETALAASRELETMNADLRRFTTMAAHDLQAPLRQIAAFAGLLRDAAGPKTSAEERDCIDTIEACARRLHRMIAGLLDVARLSRRRAAFEPADLGRVVDEACRNLAVPIAETGAVLTIEPLPQVSGSPALLVSLFQNLVANSLRHCTARPPRIAIVAGAGGITVTDNGIGIPATSAEAVFDSFVRLDPDRSPEGVGLGLSMARRIAEIHGWSLTLDTGYDRGGARFRLDLDGERRRPGSAETGLPSRPSGQMHAQDTGAGS